MSIQELYELQELDWERAEKQNALDEVRAELADESELRRARGRLARAEAEHAAQNAQRRDAQLIVEQLEAREHTVQNRLYGGAVTNPRELEAFQEEHAMLRRQIAEAEDILLERMVATEELQEALDEARRAANEIADQRRQRLPQLRESEQSLAAELETLHNERAEMLPQFPPQMLSIYETLLTSRNGHAVSKMEQNRGRDVCGACRVALPVSDTQRVRSGDAIVQCNNCRRILYLE